MPPRRRFFGRKSEYQKKNSRLASQAVPIGLQLIGNSIFGTVQYDAPQHGPGDETGSPQLNVGTTSYYVDCQGSSVGQTAEEN